MSADGSVAVVLMAYGSPPSLDEVGPYYTDIRRGRPPTEEQLAALVSRYAAIGGTAHLTERTAAQAAALQRALDDRSPGRYEVVLGLKHAEPTIEQAVATAAAAGHRRAVGLVLAPHHSAASVGQYHTRAGAAAGEHGVELTTIDSWATEPALIGFLAAQVRSTLAGLPAGSPVVFTAHSLPERAVAGGDRYADEVRATAAAVATEVGLGPWTSWSVAWQSAGRTPEPWLRPDILEVIDDLAAAGAPGVAVCACGFVSDHLEVLYDLDIEARQRAAQHGLAFARTASVNDDPAVIAALAETVISASR